MAHPVGGYAPIKVEQLLGRWSAVCMSVWVRQDEAKEGVHSADRGVAPALHADRCQQRHQGRQHNRPRRDSARGKDHSNAVAINEVSKDDWQNWNTFGGVLGLDHFVQQYHQRSGYQACYRTFEGNVARMKYWCHDHRTCGVCQLFVQAKQQIFQGSLPRLARILDAGWKRWYAVELMDELRQKEKVMLKTPSKAPPKKD